jgi:hypothetical protein
MCVVLQYGRVLTAFQDYEGNAFASGALGNKLLAILRLGLGHRQLTPVSRTGFFRQVCSKPWCAAGFLQLFFDVNTADHTVASYDEWL